jgi:hypothetical protein
VALPDAAVVPEAGVADAPVVELVAKDCACPSNKKAAAEKNWNWLT